jgi:hypothetical protein
VPAQGIVLSFVFGTACHLSLRQIKLIPLLLRLVGLNVVLSVTLYVLSNETEGCVQNVAGCNRNLAEGGRLEKVILY